MLNQAEKDVLRGYIYERSLGNISPTFEDVRGIFNTREKVDAARVYLDQIRSDMVHRTPDINFVKHTTSCVAWGFTLSACTHFAQVLNTKTFSMSEQEKVLRQYLFFGVVAVRALSGIVRYSWDRMSQSAASLRLGRVERYFEIVAQTPRINSMAQLINLISPTNPNIRTNP